jgi:hypothetical protein
LQIFNYGDSKITKQLRTEGIKLAEKTADNYMRETSVSTHDLMNVITSNHVEKVDLNDKFIDTMADFSIELFKKDTNNSHRFI